MKTFVVLLAVVAVGLAAVVRVRDPNNGLSDINSSLQASDSNKEDEYLMKLPEYKVIRPELNNFSDEASKYSDVVEATFSDEHPYPNSDESYAEKYPYESDPEETFDWPTMMPLRDFCNGKSFIPIYYGDCRAIYLLNFAEESLRMLICDPAAQQQEPGDIYH